MKIKKMGLLLAALAFGVALNAQTPEKKECCAAKSRATACTNKGSQDSKTTTVASTSKTDNTQKTTGATTSQPSKK